MGIIDLKIEMARKWKDRTRRMEILRTRSAPPDSEPDPRSEISVAIPNVNQITDSGIQAEDKEGNTNMDLALYWAAMKSDVDDFIRVLEQVATEKGLLLSDVFNQVSPIGNTYLHISVSNELDKDMVQFIAYHHPPLIIKKNFSGDSVLHLAARSGKFSVVDTLIEFKNNYVLSSDEEGNEQQAVDVQ
ncbi:hypothetical protein ACH5RR_028790 [Cinchona calisaya]|uniref:Uncharacterized protein n=1 Tax=Cinchona calisaya TaxID=153742 RepID=A0ABD2YRK9_9GENT